MSGQLEELAGGPLFLLLAKYYQKHGPVYKLMFGPRYVKKGGVLWYIYVCVCIIGVSGVDRTWVIGAPGLFCFGWGVCMCVYMYYRGWVGSLCSSLARGVCVHS